MKFVFPVTLIALGMSLFTHEAAANNPVNISGTQFVPMMNGTNNPPALCFIYYQYGIQYWRNSTSCGGTSQPLSAYVVADLPWSPSPGQTSVSVYLDFDHYSNSTTTCTLHQYDWNGTYLNYSTFTQTGAAGSYELNQTMQLLGGVPAWTYLSMTCNVTNGNVIRGVLLY